MTPNERFVQDILEMTAMELLELIYECPEYLHDSYYGQFRLAIDKRYEEIKNERTTATIS